MTGFSKFQFGTSLPLNSSEELVSDELFPEELVPPDEVVVLRSHATSTALVSNNNVNAIFLFCRINEFSF